MKFDENEFVENPSVRLPVCLILDTSSSMNANNAITELNMGIQKLYNSIRKDEITRYSVEIAIVAFEFKKGKTFPKKILDFNTIDKQPIPQLRAFGYTPLGGAVNLGLDLLKERKELYKKNGISYYQPWLFIMTDGEVEKERKEKIERATSRTKKMILEKKLTVYTIGMGNNANMQQLQDFTISRAPLKIKHTDLEIFFNWIAKSMEVVSNGGDFISSLTENDFTDFKGEL